MSRYMTEDDDVKYGSIVRDVAIGLFSLITVLSSVNFIGAGSVGVVTQFGSTTGRIMEPGLNFKIPFIQGVWVADTKMQKEQQKMEAASQDLQIVNSTIALNYHIEKNQAESLYKSIGVELLARMVDPAMQEAFKSTTAKFTAAQLIQDRPKVKESVIVALKDRLHKNGIMVDDISIVNFSFSDEFEKSIEAKQVAQQQAERAKYTLEAAKKDSQAQDLQKNTLSKVLLTKLAIEKWDGKMPQYLGQSSLFGMPLK